MKQLFDVSDGWVDRSALYKAYRQAEARFRLTRIDEALGRLFNFSDNTVRPVHGWYMFKEGFSWNLVGHFINRYDPGPWLVVDPFCGSGTTVLEAQLRGHNAQGVEVNPFFIDVASTKLRWWQADAVALQALVERIVTGPGSTGAVREWPELTSFRRLYSDEVLEELFHLKDLIHQVTEADSFHRSFLLLGLTSILELTSRAYKTGKGLKFRKRQPITSASEVRSRARDKWEQMLRDVSALQGREQPRGEANVQQGDARELPLDDNCAQLVIYSPPYANTFDYNEVYKLEMWFLGHVKSYEEWRRVKEASLRSHVSLRIGLQNEGDELLERALSLVEAPARGETEMLRAYFTDMGKALLEQRRVTRKGGHVVIIVGNSSYRCVPIATDLILARIAESQGFAVEEIRVGRRLNTSSQQMAVYNARGDDGLKFVRESAVILRRC